MSGSILKVGNLHCGSGIGFPATCRTSPDMHILLDYPSVHDIKAGHLTGYPASILDVCRRYSNVGEPTYVTLFPHPAKFDNPSSFFHPRKDCPDLAAGNPYHKQLGYLRSEYLPHYQQAREECRKAPLVLALGDLSLWALAGERMLDHRGTILYWDGLRIIPSHHPRAVIKDHSLLPVLAMDMRKAWRESLKPHSVFPRRTLRIVESVADMRRATEAILRAGTFAFDIETSRQQITMICFAPSPHEVYVVPIFNPTNAWSEEDELRIWAYIQILMASRCRKIAHNAVYDLTYLTMMGIEIKFPVDDTMLLAHSTEIEWQKSLGFLGSIYCNEKSWKLMRIGKVKDRNKKDE